MIRCTLWKVWLATPGHAGGHPVHLVAPSGTPLTEVDRMGRDSVLAIATARGDDPAEAAERTAQLEVTRIQRGDDVWMDPRSAVSS